MGEFKCVHMLCASVLAALEAATPVEQRVPPPSDEVASNPASVDYPSSDDAQTSTVSTVSASSPDSTAVGVPRDWSGLADSTIRAYMSMDKWIIAALRVHGKVLTDLILPSMEPNDMLCSQVQSTIAEWSRNRIIGRDAGVVDHRPSELAKPPQKDCMPKSVNEMRRYINQRRAEHDPPIGPIPDKWADDLPCRKAQVKSVNKATVKHKAETGELFHHKHDFSLTEDQLTKMTYVGFCADQRVHCDILEALEAGMSLALLMPTGARGKELKTMHLQSLGYETRQDPNSGLEFEKLKLTAFETKTKAQHVNELLPHSHPWRCGVGLLGLSLLVRVKRYGPPPFTMAMDENSWMILGSNVNTLHKRINEVCEKVANVGRQNGDPETYIGRQLGTRLLQDAGGSAEGGDARRGHNTGSAKHHYIGVPLPDLLRLAGNFADKPFIPAHLQPQLHPLADKVLLLIFPELAAHEEKVRARQLELKHMRGNIVKIRTDEQLNDQEKITNALRLACRTALCCLVARPRSWKQWTIIENESTVWKRAMQKDHRVAYTLFAGNTDAIAAMDALAQEVQRCEEAEIQSRSMSSERDQHVLASVKELQDQQREFHRQMMAQLASSKPTSVPELPAFRSEVRPSEPPSVCADDPASRVRIKHKREQQSDVVPFSTWHSVSDAIEYARKELVPQEREQGRKWRVLVRTDGREDKARDKQWRNYCTLAIAVGLQMRGGSTYDEAVATLQSRLDAFGAKAHTPLLRSIGEEIKNIRDRDAIAKEVLGY